MFKKAIIREGLTMKNKMSIHKYLLCLIFVSIFIFTFASMSAADEMPEPLKEMESMVNIFSIDSEGNSGVAQQNISIIVPPGRKGVSPKLSLKYNSNSKNGWVGVGWSLDMGSIQRNTKWGLNYTTDDFIAVGNGSASELVSRGDWGTDYFGAKIEKSFSKYYYDRSSDSWVMTAKNGTSYYYGSTAASRQDDHPTSPTRVFKWCLDKVEDVNGNYMEITYIKDSGQIYLDEITYTGNTPAGELPKYKVEFTTDNSRTDAYAVYKTHFSVTTANRLKTIEVYHNTSGSDELIRKYELYYIESTSTKRSLLDKVTLFGSDGATALPATTFTYNDMVQGFDTLATQWHMPLYSGENQDIRTAEGAGEYTYILDIRGGSVSADGTNQNIIDINGDGLPDRITKGGNDGTNNYIDVYLNNGLGFDNSPTRWYTYDSTAYARLSGMSDGWQWPQGSSCSAGHMDVENKSGYPYGSIAFHNTGPWLFYSQCIGNAFVDYYRSFEDIFDINGDGLADRVTASNISGSLKVYLNNKENVNGFDDYIEWSTPGDNAFLLSDETYYKYTHYSGVAHYFDGEVYSEIFTYSFKWARTLQDIMDMDGDGRPDLVTQGDTSGQLKVYLNTGSGFNPTAIQWDATGTSKYIRQQNSTGIHEDIVDMNGDGLPDRVTTSDATHLKVYLNTGSGFNPTAIEWETPQSNTGWSQYVSNKDTDGLYQGLIDMNGDGLPDRVTNSPNSDSDLRVYINTGNGFIDRGVDNEWHTPDDTWSKYVKNGVYQDIFDLNGDGLPDRVTSSSSRDQDFLNIYASSEEHPDLLKTVNGSLGSTTTITYEPSTIYTDTQIPFALQTVSSVTVDDGNGVLSETSFDYSGGYFDPDDREYRGFEQVIKYVKREDGGQTYIKTLFNQGRDNDPLSTDYVVYKGLPEIQETGDYSGETYTPYVKVVNEFDKRLEYDDIVDDNDVYFPHLKDTDKYEYGTETSRQTREEFLEYDSFGNLSHKKYHGLYPNTGGGAGDEYEEFTLYTSTVVNNMTIALLTETRIEDSPGSIKAKTTYGYHSGTANLETETRLCSPCPTSETDPVNTYNTYDNFGNPTNITDPRGNVTTIDYDTATYTFPWKVTNVVGFTQKFYDYRFGKPQSVQDYNSNSTEYRYDVFGRTIKKFGPYDTEASPTIEHEYLDIGIVGEQRVKTIRREDHVGIGSGTIWSETYFDVLGRTIKVQAEGPDDETIVTEKEYNLMGLVKRESLPYFEGDVKKWTSYLYDPVSRVETITNPDSSESSVSYDTGLKFFTDANGHVKAEETDGYGRVKYVYEYSTDKLGTSYPYATTEYRYDVLGNLTHTIDAEGNWTAITYDTLSRKIHLDDPDMGNWTYQHDANGDLRFQTDAKEQTIEFQYDALNRVIFKRYPGYPAVPDITYTYDQILEPASEGLGRLTTLVDDSGTTEFFYDKLGQIYKTIKTVDAVDYTTENAYDALGRTKTITYPDTTPLVIEYIYDTAGNLEKVRNQSTLDEYAFYSDYNALGQVSRIDYLNDVYTLYEYDINNYRLSSIRTSDEFGTDLMHLTYDAYDNVGNIETITDMVDPTRSRTYRYDSLNRLIQEKNTSSGEKLVYQYDKIGNMTYNCRNGHYIYDYLLHPHAVKRIEMGGEEQASYLYDANGNMTSRDGATIEYNFDNMPKLINYGSSTVESVYDAHGQRAKKIVNDTIETVYIGQIYECTGSICKKNILAGGQMVAHIDDTGNYFYHSDHLGSSSVITKGDESNYELVQEMHYYPYGERRDDDSSDVTDYTYTGQEWDAESDLYYYGARFYDPKLARFISADPVVPMRANESTFKDIEDIYSLDKLAQQLAEYDEDDSLSNIDSDVVRLYYKEFGEPQKLNRYTYVGNNPVNWVDPLGLWEWQGEMKYYSGGADIGLGYLSVNLTTYKGIYNYEAVYSVNIFGATVGSPVGFTRAELTMHDGWHDFEYGPDALRMEGISFIANASVAWRSWGYGVGLLKMGDGIANISGPLVGFDFSADLFLGKSTLNSFTKTNTLTGETYEWVGYGEWSMVEW